MPKRTLVTAVTMLLLAGPLRTQAVVHVGDPAPDFTKTELAGATNSLSDYFGNVIVLFLFGYS